MSTRPGSQTAAAASPAGSDGGPQTCEPPAPNAANAAIAAVNNPYAGPPHVFLPGSSFLEKNGTFTNAERRISPVRKVMEPKNGYEDWEITVMLSNALGYPKKYKHASEKMDEVARLTPTFKGVSFKKLDE